MMAQAQRVMRGEALRAATVLAEVAIGLGVLLLFLVAVAWDPFDRRWGARPRRAAARQAPADEAAAPAADAYAIVPARRGEGEIDPP